MSKPAPGHNTFFPDESAHHFIGSESGQVSYLWSRSFGEMHHPARLKGEVTKTKLPSSPTTCLYIDRKRSSAVPCSALAQWEGQTGVQLQPLVDALREAVLGQRVVHADATPVQMLAPGEKKTHRAYFWAYSSMSFSALKAVVYDFSPSRAGEHARNFLGA